MPGIFEHFVETLGLIKEINFLYNCHSLKKVAYYGVKQQSVM
jgi:hypothetical protein